MSQIMDEYMNTYSDQLFSGSLMSQIGSDISCPIHLEPLSCLQLPTLSQDLIFAEPLQHQLLEPEEPDLSRQLTAQPDSASSLLSTMSQYTPASPTQTSHTEAFRQYHEAMSALSSVESASPLAAPPSMWPHQSALAQEQETDDYTISGHPSSFYANGRTLQAHHNTPSPMRRSLSVEHNRRNQDYIPFPTYHLPPTPPMNYMPHPRFSHTNNLFAERAPTSAPGSPFSSDHESTQPDLIGPTAVGENSPYAQWLFVCLKEVPGHQMILRDIYEWARNRIPKVIEAIANDPNEKGWQNSIRHNLSMNKVSTNLFILGVSSNGPDRLSPKLISTPPKMAKRQLLGACPRKPFKREECNPRLATERNP
jgi:hypothetical protein